jgi:hypothetical protein
MSGNCFNINHKNENSYTIKKSCFDVALEEVVWLLTSTYLWAVPSDNRRKRPYTIGASADVAAAQRMYPYITPYQAKIDKGEHGPR